jgi:hypothetical protein
MLLKPFYVFPLFFRANIYDSCRMFCKRNYYCRKCNDLHFTDAQRDSMVTQMNTNLKFYKYLHEFNLPNSVPYQTGLILYCQRWHSIQNNNPLNGIFPADVAMPADTNQLAFYSIAQLSSLLRHHKITSVQLTQFFINRLKTWRHIALCYQPYGTNSNGTS